MCLFQRASYTCTVRRSGSDDVQSIVQTFGAVIESSREIRFDTVWSRIIYLYRQLVAQADGCQYIEFWLVLIIGCMFVAAYIIVAALTCDDGNDFVMLCVWAM